MNARLAIVPLLAALAGCVAQPMPYWTPETRTVDRLDYAAWDALLAAHVVDGRVDYPGFRADPAFAEFLYRLRKARFTRDTSEEQRLAFWINAYNAAAIAGILDGDSPAGRLGRMRFFLRRRHAVGGEAITLWDLEHERIVRAGDPRAHFAIACAAASCPRLATEALRPELLDAQLEGLARAFVNDAERNRFDLDAGTARLSLIFEWFADEFAAAEGSVAAYVARYVDDERVAEALREGRLEIETLEWDWRLNGTPLPEE